MRTITRDIVGAIVISSDDRLLLGMTDPKKGVYGGHWVLPGGGIEPGETKRQALNREMIEETCLDISPYPAELVASDSHGQSEKTLKDTGERVIVNMNFFDYEIRLPMTAAESGAKPTEELEQILWAPLSQLGNEKLAGSTLDLLKRQGYL